MITTIVPRTLEHTAKRAMKTFPVTLVTGPRQSGKTTLLQESFGGSHHYVSLDLPAVRERALADPVGFLKDNRPPVIIDEIQNVPELFHYIKSHVDRDRKPLIKGPVIGQLFETMVVSEIIKLFFHRGEKPNIYYWRTKTGLEVDLLIERNMKRYGLEMKSTSTILPGHTTALTKWRDLSGNDAVYCLLVHGGDESFTLNEVRVLPWHRTPDMFCQPA